MSKRASASQRRKSQESLSAAWKIGGAVAVVGLVCFLYIRSMDSHKALDATTLCPTHPTSVTVLLVDVTDQMNLAQRQDFLNQLDRLVDQIPRYGKIVIAKVDPVSDRLLVPVITRCNPGSAADTSDIDGNPQKLEKLHRENFIAPINGAYDSLLAASGADRSPILESIQSVALTELNSPSVGDVPKRLIVASDLLQNTDTISFYRGLPDPKAFVSGQPFNRARTDLKHVQVELWMLQRDDSVTTQPRALAMLWEHIIDAEGGILGRVYNVSG